MNPGGEKWVRISDGNNSVGGIIAHQIRNAGRGTGLEEASVGTEVENGVI